MKTKGLIFDLDGTLTLTQQFHYQAFSEVFKKDGLVYSPADDLRYAGKGSSCIFPEFFAEHGIKITAEEVKAYADAKKTAYDRIIHQARIEPVPGIKTFLEKAKSKGLKMIVATGNKLEATRYILEKAGLNGYFGDIVTNLDVTKSKPAPDIFLKAAEKLQLNPSECIVFEDSLNGIQAAKAGQIPCVALATGHKAEDLSKTGAQIVIADYTDLKLNELF
jgi:beta-phosphoglucomutase family hydrolase